MWFVDLQWYMYYTIAGNMSPLWLFYSKNWFKWLHVTVNMNNQFKFPARYPTPPALCADSGLLQLGISPEGEFDTLYFALQQRAYFV